MSKSLRTSYDLGHGLYNYLKILDSILRTVLCPCGWNFDFGGTIAGHKECLPNHTLALFYVAALSMSGHGDYSLKLLATITKGFPSDHFCTIVQHPCNYERKEIRSSGFRLQSEKRSG